MSKGSMRRTVKNAGRIEHVLLGQLLRELRDQSGLSQTALALRLGKSNNSYVSKVESGDQAIDIATLSDWIKLTGGRLSEVMMKLEAAIESQ